MIADINKTIREILLVEGRIDLTEIDISFDLPSREWSARISKPTINCYLFDLRERSSIREKGWITETNNGRRERRQPPMFMALTYLVTAWTNEVEDEHRLLWHTLDTLARFPRFPDDLLQGELRRLQEPFNVISSDLAQAGSVLKSPSEFWTSLDNHLKPSITYTVTAPLAREAEQMGPPTRGFRLRLQALDQADTDQEEVSFIGGLVRNAAGEPIAGAEVGIAALGRFTRSDEAGRYRFPQLPAGEYTITLNYQNHHTEHTIVAPQQTDINLTD